MPPNDQVSDRDWKPQLGLIGMTSLTVRIPSVRHSSMEPAQPLTMPDYHPNTLTNPDLILTDIPLIDLPPTSTLSGPPPLIHSASTGGNKRGFESGEEEAPLQRASKRPRAVKFSHSPAKLNGKNRERRTGGNKSVANGSKDMEPINVPNRDYCDACGGKGNFLCCDGCPRSFHFACLDPPLELDETPEDDHWFCKVCRWERDPKPVATTPLFGELITRTMQDNAKAFALPQSVRGAFKDVSTAPAGEYINLREYRAPKVNKQGLVEERDPYRGKDRHGKTILCFSCGTAPSLPLNRRIISCDFCDQHWHLDCLDPPLIGYPPASRRWMCPAHAEHAQKSKRRSKHQIVVTVTDRRMANNGDIEIIPRERAPSPEWEELNVNGIRYQVPEDVIVLDFLGALRGERPNPTPRKAQYRRKSPSRVLNSADSSPLTSLSSTPEIRPSPLPEATSSRALLSASRVSDLPLPSPDAHSSAATSFLATRPDIQPYCEAFDDYKTHWGGPASARTENSDLSTTWSTPRPSPSPEPAQGTDLVLAPELTNIPEMTVQGPEGEEPLPLSDRKMTPSSIDSSISEFEDLITPGLRSKGLTDDGTSTLPYTSELLNDKVPPTFKVVIPAIGHYRRASIPKRTLTQNSVEELPAAQIVPNDSPMSLPMTKTSSSTSVNSSGTRRSSRVRVRDSASPIPVELPSTNSNPVQVPVPAIKNGPVPPLSIPTTESLPPLRIKLSLSSHSKESKSASKSKESTPNPENRQSTSDSIKVPGRLHRNEKVEVRDPMANVLTVEELKVYTRQDMKALNDLRKLVIERDHGLRKPMAEELLGRECPIMTNDEDMATVIHVRKLLEDKTYADQKPIILDFLHAETPPIPNLAWMEEMKRKIGWDVPWGIDVC